MDKCKNCGAQIHAEHFPPSVLGITWVDNSGGDVCGWDGGNEPHEPSDE